jgi:hypothetical protein
VVKNSAMSMTSPSWASKDSPNAVRAAPAVVAENGSNSIGGGIRAIKTNTMAIKQTPA